MPDQFEFIPGGALLQRLPDQGGEINRFQAVVPPQDAMAGRYDQYRSKLGDLPVDQALKAINAAEQFLAMRMAQKDIAAGVPPAEAVMKRFAPVWGNQPRYAGTAMRGTFDALPPSIQQIGPDGTPVLTGRNVKLMPQQENLEFVAGPENTQFWRMGNRGGQVKLPEGLGGEKNIQPKEMTLSDGTRLLYNPATGAFRVMTPSGPKDFTPQQLSLIADNTEDEGIKKQIHDFLASTATNQIARATTPKTAPKPKADPTGTDAAAAPVAQTSQSPYAEGTKLRNKRDGKMYVVRNGVPVLEEK